ADRAWLPCSCMTSPRATERGLQRRRRRMAVAVGMVAVVAVIGFVLAAVALFGGGSDDGSSHAGTTRSSGSGPATSTATTAAPTTSAPPGTASAPALAIGTTYPVGTSSATFVDTSRSTSPNGSFAGAPSRTLPTQFWFPAASDGSPDRADGPYPLVLFSHGYDVTPHFYAPLLERWAAAGYVVAAPTYPILSGSDGGATDV